MQGPLRCQILLTVGDPTVRFDFDQVTKAVNRSLADAKETLRIESTSSAYGSWSLLTTKVANNHQLEIVQKCIVSKFKLTTSVEVALLLSKSYMKVIDVPALTRQGGSTTPENVLDAMCSSTHQHLFILASPVRVVRNSKATDTAMAYFEVWDSKRGVHAHRLDGITIQFDDSATAINLLHQEVDNLPAFHYVGGDFNCHSSVWDPCWSRLVNHGNTLILHNLELNGSVIDLVWTQPQPDAINLPRLEHDHRGTSDHVPISILLPIVEADIRITRTVVPKGSNEEKAFLGDISLGLGLVDTMGLDSDDKIEAAAHAVAEVFSGAWQHHTKEVVITNRSKSWWNDKCDVAIKHYHESRNPVDYTFFWQATQAAKRTFFDEKIEEMLELP
ncbi:hypothetical protein NP233_g8541 [Leucocoprinus birnbaumii]|uniref:Endonuclease/exonuclease/phosphatase domain-containing protein n=1 Tax=Leucocoprinus birnbaumii TaxID=56174 RepID=A0AAD5VQQ6_9AGAR|nr:hypothetical protein NP233_g8541 [Leucocoprinus birnbaumii]